MLDDEVIVDIAVGDANLFGVHLVLDEFLTDSVDGCLAQFLPVARIEARRLEARAQAVDWVGKRRLPDIRGAAHRVLREPRPDLVGDKLLHQLLVLLQTLPLLHILGLPLLPFSIGALQLPPLQCFISEMNQ